MAGISNYSASSLLDWLAGVTAMPALGSRYLALFTTMPADDGTGGVEAAFTGYARVSVPAGSWGAVSGTGPMQITNTSAV